MKIQANTIIWKSNPVFFEKERTGKKCNTIRRLSPEESEELEENRDNLTSISIVNSETGAIFHRVLTDISTYYGLYIFSWKWVL